MRLALLLVFTAACAHGHGRYADAFDAGGTARLQYVLAEQEGPFGEDAIRTSFTAGMDRALLDDDLPVKVLTSGRASVAADAEVEVRLGPAAVYDGEGAQIVDLPVRVAVREGERVLWRFDLPCSREGYFTRGLDTEPEAAPAGLLARHARPAGAERAERPVWTDTRAPFLALGASCGEALVAKLNDLPRGAAPEPAPASRELASPTLSYGTE